MAINLEVNNNTYAYPSPGDEPGWGQAATGWATEVTTVLSTIVNADDILETGFNIANSVSSVANVTALSFNPGTVRSVDVEYSIYRFSSLNELSEAGTLTLVFKNGGTIGSKWSIGRVSVGDDAGVNFFMTDAGQMQYTSTAITGTSYQGTLKFTAKTTNQ